MGSAQRIYYPLHAVGFATLGTVLPTGTMVATGYRAAKGVQSLGINTTFNLEQVYQLGQLSLYDNIEQIPDVEITLEKILDGYALLQHLSTPIATASTLAGRYNDNRCQIAVAYYDQTLDHASGVPLSTVVMSGMYVSSIGFNIPVEGSMRETVSFTGNDKIWNFTPSGVWTSGTRFTGSESPLAPYGILQRDNVIMASSLWPKEIPGIDNGGINQTNGASGYSAHIQNVTINANLGRTSLFELGSKAPYFRYANFPVEITTAIELTSNERGDAVNALSTQDNLTNQTIKVVLNDGITIDLGSKNKLSSINKSGGETGGGNVTTTYNYSNFNDLKVLMPSTDPAGLSS
jgi:hypothetical protein